MENTEAGDNLGNVLGQEHSEADSNNRPTGSSEYEDTIVPLHIDLKRRIKVGDIAYARSIIPQIKWHQPFSDEEKDELRKIRKERAKGKAGRKKGDEESWADYVEEHPKECHGYNRRHLEKILNDNDAKVKGKTANNGSNNKSVKDGTEQPPQKGIPSVVVRIGHYQRDDGTVIVRVYSSKDGKYYYRVAK